MNHGSLFSGIGGFDLAAEWMGWENKFHCEWNEFCQRVLKYYWPDAKSYGDIDKTDFTIWRGIINVLSGGFPCQPYSTGGKRQGKEDARHKWPQMLRAIREIQPGYVVGENVRGLTNWNEGMVFDEVQADLEAEGYEVLPFLLPACGVNAPHRRDRIWFVAHSCYNGYRRDKGFGFNTSQEGNDKSKGNKRERIRNAVERDVEKGIITDAKFEGRERGNNIKESIRSQPGAWNNWPTAEPSICSGDDGVSERLDGITFSKWRNASIKSYGNAIVPQVAYQIFKVIEEMNQWQKV